MGEVQYGLRMQAVVVQCRGDYGKTAAVRTEFKEIGQAIEKVKHVGCKELE